MSGKEQLPGLKIRRHFVMDFTVVMESDPAYRNIKSISVKPAIEFYNLKYKV